MTTSIILLSATIVLLLGVAVAILIMSPCFLLSGQETVPFEKRAAEASRILSSSAVASGFDLSGKPRACNASGELRMSPLRKGKVPSLARLAMQGRIFCIGGHGGSKLASAMAGSGFAI